MSALLIPVLFVLALYLLMIRPQRRRVQAQRALVSSLTPGQRVVTAGGMIGTLVDVDDERAAVEVAPGVVIDFLAPAVVRVLDAGGAGPAGDGTADPVQGSVGDANGSSPAQPGPESTDPLAPRHEES